MDVHFVLEDLRFVFHTVSALKPCIFCVCRLRDGIYNVLSISSLGNQYIQANKPWDLLKGSDEDRSVSIDICSLFILSNIYWSDALLSTWHRTAVSR